MKEKDTEDLVLESIEEPYYPGQKILLNGDEDEGEMIVNLNSAVN